MEKEEVNEKKEIANSNDTNKFEEVEIYQEVEPIKKEKRIGSYFDGGLIELIGWRLLSFLITVVTLGIAAPWGACMIYSYEINHTVYNGKRLKFEGTGGDLFVNIFKWVLLSIVTFGIYALFIPVKKTKWVIANIHFEDEQLIKNESFFDGKTIQLIGINILCKILNFISLGLLSAFTVCFKLKWINKYTIINRKRLVFDGKAISLFGKYILWGFLTAITFGIFGLWVPIKNLKWQNKNTHIKVVGEEEQKDKSIYIVLPVLIVGIILFSLIIPKLITTVGNTNGIEEIFENFESSFSGNENSTNISNKEAISLEPNMSVTNNNTSTSNSNDKTLEFDISEFTGTYIDVFGSSETLTLDNNGKVTISGRVITNNLSSITKQSDGSYSCHILGGEIIIYPVGVKSSQGNSGKVTIDVLENGGALCFQSE